MLMSPSKYERDKNSFPSPVLPDLLLGGSGTIARALFWKNQEFSPVDISPPLFSMLIYHLQSEQ
jgi:hypothetical protein